MGMLVRFFERRLFRASRCLVPVPDGGVFDREEVRFASLDGTSLWGWHVVPRGRGASTSGACLLVCHGNSGNLSTPFRVGLMETLALAGARFFIFDYRGFGKSGGVPSEAGTCLDAEAAWRHLVEERGVDAKSVGIFGRSLGSPFAAKLAADHPETPFLVLESAFRSLSSMAGVRCPWLPASWTERLCRERFATEHHLRRLRTGVPVLFLHGTADRLVPFREGERLFEGFPGKKALVVLEGAGHMSYLSHRDAYLEGFRAGLAELLGNVPW